MTLKYGLGVTQGHWTKVIITGPPSFKRHPSQYSLRFIYIKISGTINSRGKAESANLKIICLLIKCSLLAAV